MSRRTLRVRIRPPRSQTTGVAPAAMSSPRQEDEQEDIEGEDSASTEPDNGSCSSGNELSQAEVGQLFSGDAFGVPIYSHASALEGRSHGRRRSLVVLPRGQGRRGFGRRFRLRSAEEFSNGNDE